MPSSDLVERGKLIEEAVHRFGLCFEEILMPIEVVRIYDAVQPDNEITLRHVEAAVMMITDTPFCSKEEVFDVMQDLDRRNFLLRDLKWEFAFLDADRSGCLPLDKGYFLFRAIHGTHLKGAWERFIEGRMVPESRLAYEELSLILCDVLDSSGGSDDII